MKLDDPSISFAPVQKTTLVESVMEQIIEQVRKGQLQPGARLPSERALMAMMNVGRSTVREALQALAAMDLIETRSGEGSHVKDISPLSAPADGMTTATLQQSMRLQLLEMRQLVEGQVALWAVEKATQNDVERVRQMLEDYIQLTEAGAWPESHRAHHLFHSALAESSHNLFAVRVVSSLVATVPQSLSQKFVLSSREVWAQEHAIHRGIFEALQARDCGHMADAIRSHMDAERRQIMAT
jgi:GntR family transcriptional repressor for pyruvate dehydrogenase complex